MASKDIKPNKDALKLRVTKGNLTVCRLHYAADETKNPQNPVGMKWVKQALSGYAGGMRDPRWLKEMEIQYGAGGGTKVFPEWDNWLRDSNIFIDGDVDISGAKIYGSYDHGYRNPACYLVHAIYPDQTKRTIWEFYASDVTVPFISQIILGNDTTLPDGRRIKGNPYAGKEVLKICDPEIMRATQVMEKGPNRSVAHLFSQEGVHFSAGTKGDDGTVVNWLNGNLWLDPNRPWYQIHRSCTNLIWELGKLHTQALTPLMSRKRNEHETLVDKDNHAWDALKYWLKRFPVGVKVNVEQKKEADFEFWMKAAKKGRVRSSYVREFAK